MLLLSAAGIALESCHIVQLMAAKWRMIISYNHVAEFEGNYDVWAKKQAGYTDDEAMHPVMQMGVTEAEYNS